MYWMIAGLLVLGVACGALLRLMFFVGVLLGAAVIAVVVVSTAHGGIGAALLSALIAVVTLQIGYVIGVVLRAVVRSRQSQTPERAVPKRPVSAPLGEKRH